MPRSEYKNLAADKAFNEGSDPARAAVDAAWKAGDSQGAPKTQLSSYQGMDPRKQNQEQLARLLKARNKG